MTGDQSAYVGTKRRREDPGPQRDDPGDRMTVVGHFNHLAGYDAFQHPAPMARRRETGRAHAVVLTPAGRRLLDHALQLAIGIEQELCADLQPGERDQLLRLLARLASRDSGHPGVHPGLSAAPAGRQPGE